jgi:dolichol-phosphate mannosyltransferase
MVTPFQTLNHSLPRPDARLAAPVRLEASVVLSVADEAGNIAPLVAEIVAAMNGIQAFRNRFEIIFVDDQSLDATRDEIMQAMLEHDCVRLICHSARYGKSQGVYTGIRHALGEWIITMDGDGQNDPADIAKLWKAIETHVPAAMASGVRVNRKGTFGKRLASKFANWLRRTLLGDDCPDTGCALKMFQRNAYLALPYFDHMHRYEPTLFRLYGHRVVYVPVNDRARVHGVSKYGNMKRALVGVFDLIGLMWLQRRFKARLEQSTEVELLVQEQEEEKRLEARG